MSATARRQPWLHALCVAGAMLFGGLGLWQVQRLVWKRDLIARVDARIHAEPVAAPGAASWHNLDVREVEYLRVQARGTFLHDRETLVDALTARGPGSWVLTPLRTAEGVILVNRGFVPPSLRPADARADAQAPGEVVVTGLLRRSEPAGRILRSNDPDAGRWFSRDVRAIAKVHGLDNVAPYFIDADNSLDIAGGPAGGMTVVRFRNAHLSYAITWFALAALCISGLVLLRNLAGAGDES